MKWNEINNRHENEIQCACPYIVNNEAERAFESLELETHHQYDDSSVTNKKNIEDIENINKSQFR